MFVHVGLFLLLITSINWSDERLNIPAAVLYEFLKPGVWDRKIWLNFTYRLMAQEISRYVVGDMVKVDNPRDSFAIKVLEHSFMLTAGGKDRSVYLNVLFEFCLCFENYEDLCNYSDFRKDLRSPRSFTKDCYLPHRLHCR